MKRVLSILLLICIAGDLLYWLLRSFHPRLFNSGHSLSSSLGIGLLQVMAMISGAYFGISRLVRRVKRWTGEVKLNEESEKTPWDSLR
jgi:Kef-type K+ transport system membrane component KefB